MKIQYKFATETVTIEVDERWGELLVDLNRQEYNNDHKETRRHSSIGSSIPPISRSPRTSGKRSPPSAENPSFDNWGLAFPRDLR